MALLLFLFSEIYVIKNITWFSLDYYPIQFYWFSDRSPTS